MNRVNLPLVKRSDLMHARCDSNRVDINTLIIWFIRITLTSYSLMFQGVSVSFACGRCDTPLLLPNNDANVSFISSLVKTKFNAAGTKIGVAQSGRAEGFVWSVEKRVATNVFSLEPGEPAMLTDLDFLGDEPRIVFVGTWMRYHRSPKTGTSIIGRRIPSFAGSLVRVYDYDHMGDEILRYATAN